MALLSLVLLLIAVILGFTRKMNTGLLAIALAVLLSRVAGIKDADIIRGFNTSLFVMLLGVSYLFSLCQLNGTLDLLAKKVVALAGKRSFLVPILVYVFTVVMAAIGPGTVPTVAIMTVFAMPMAVRMGISPVLMASLIVVGGAGGGLSPLATTGIIGLNLAAKFGLTGIEMPYLFDGIFTATVYCTIMYFVLGGYKVHAEASAELADLPAFNGKQKVTLLAIAVLVFMVMVLRINVGLSSFAIAAVLSLLKISDEKEALKRVPWGTLLLITGVGILMHQISALGGIKMLSNALLAIINEKTAVSIVGLCSGVLSWFSSTSGVVMPTFIPTIPHIVARLGEQNVNPVEMLTAISMIASTAGISPLSTGGALSMAAYSSTVSSDPRKQNALFMKLFACSAGSVLLVSILAYFGLYSWIL